MSHPAYVRIVTMCAILSSYDEEPLPPKAYELADPTFYGLGDYLGD